MPSHRGVDPLADLLGHVRHLQRRDEHPGVRVGDLVRDLLGGEVAVDERHVITGAGRRPVELEIPDMVLRQHRERVTPGEPEFTEQVRQPDRTVVEFGIADALAGDGGDNRRLVRRARREVSEVRH